MEFRDLIRTVCAWNGLYVYDKNLVSISPTIDYVVVSGMIKYYGLPATFDRSREYKLNLWSYRRVITTGTLEVSTYDVNGDLGRVFRC